MAASAFETLPFERPRKSVDPIFELLRQGDFEEVSRSRRAAMRVMRRSRDGLSVYVRSEESHAREFTHHRSHYSIAYEGELEDGRQVQLIILECDASASIMELLELLGQHAQYVRLRIEPILEESFAGAIEIEKLAGYDAHEAREAVTQHLSRLALRPLSEDAYPGFVAAVISQVDEYIGRRSRLKK